MYEEALDYDQDQVLPQDPYQQDREAEQRDEQGVEWIDPKDLTIAPNPAAEAALDRGKSVPLPEITWLSPDELSGKKPAAAQPHQHAATSIVKPKIPTTARELATDTGVVMSRASDALGGTLVRDTFDLVAGNQGQQAQAKENFTNMGKGFLAEPKRVWDEANKSGSAMVDLGKHAIQGKGTEAYNDLVEAIYHGVGAVPIFGAPVQAITDEAVEGKYREALGDALGLFGSVLNPGKTPKPGPIRLPFVGPLKRNIGIKMGNNAKALEASRYLTGEGVTPNAAAATDSNFVKGLQRFSKNTPMGAHVGEGLAAQTGRELNDLSERLTERAHPNKVFTPETAGQSMDAALQAREQYHADLRKRHYTAVEVAEAHPHNIQSVQVGWQEVPGGAPGAPPAYVPLMKDVGLPVDLRGFRQANRAAYETMKAQMGKAFEQYTPAFQALRNLMEYQEYIVPASFVENELGAIKKIGRETKDGRARGLAKFMTPQVQAMVDDAMSRAIAGDPANDIKIARKATSTMYDVRDFIKKLKSDQSVDAFHQLVQPGDANIEVLREARQWAPGEMTKLARAWLDEGFNLATNEDGFKHAQALYTRWTKLGDSTKALLFTPQLASELDKFFLGAQKIAENPNPSGTSHVAHMVGTSGATAASAIANPLLGAALLYGQAKFARFFHTPAGVRLLTEGFNVQVGSPRYSTLLKQLRRMAVMDNTQEKKTEEERQGPPQFAAGGPVRYAQAGAVEDDDVLREMERRQLAALSVDPSYLVRQSTPEPKRPAMGPPEATTYGNIPDDASYSQAVSQANPVPKRVQEAVKAVSAPGGMSLVGPGGVADFDSYGAGAGNVIGGISTLVQTHGPRDVAKGTTELIGGAMEAGLPLMAGGIKAPKQVLDLALKIGAGALTEQAIKKAAEYLGVHAEYADLLGLAAGLGTAHFTPSAAETAAVAKRTPGAVQDFVNNSLNYSGANPERGAISNRPTNAAGNRVRGTWDDVEKEYKPHPTDVERMEPRLYSGLTGLQQYDVAGSPKEQKIRDTGLARAEREANRILSWRNWDRPEMEAKYGPLVASHPLDIKRDRFQNTPEQVQRRIQNARDFLRQPVEEFHQPDFGVFERQLIKDAMWGFPGVEQTQHARTIAPQADLSHLHQTYQDPVNEELIRLAVERGRKKKGDLFYPSVYPLKVAALEEGIPEADFNRWVYATSPASAQNSVIAENSGGNLLYKMWKQGIPFTKQNLEIAKAQFKQRYGLSPSLMETHMGPTSKILHEGRLPSDVIRDNLTSHYKIPTYSIGKAGDFKNYFVGDVHESRGTTLGSRWHPYFAEQQGFGGNEYGPMEGYMRDLARKIDMATGPMQGARWHGAGELTGLRSEPGDWLNTIEKQAAYTMHGQGMRTQPKDVRRYLLDLIRQGGDLAPYSGGDPMPDRRAFAPTSSRRTRSRGGR